MTMDRPVDQALRRRRRMLRLGVVAAAATALVGVAVWTLSLRAADYAVDASRLTLDAAVVAPLGEVATFSAQVVPLDLVRVDAVEPAIVAERFVEPGDSVSMGQPLLRLASPEREASISSRIAQILSDLSGLRGQELQIEQARQSEASTLLEAEYSLQRATQSLSSRQALAEGGFVNEAFVKPYRDEVALYARIVPELRQTQRQSDRLRALQGQAISRQEATLQQNLAAARRQLEDFTIRSSVGGRILTLDAEAGALVTQGQTLARVDPERGVGLEADVDEFYARRLRPGMVANVEIQGRTHRLRVDRTDPEVRDGAFRIQMSFVEAAPASLRPGETLRATLRLGEDRRVLTVRNGPFMEASNGAYAYVLAPDGRTAHRVPVRTGVRSADRVEIVQGLKPGDSIITSEYASFGEADTVRIKGNPRP